MQPQNGETSSDHATQLMQAAAAGEAGARERLLALIYEQLRAMARRRMGAEKADHTLQATALVHEAYLRLIGSHSASWTSRVEFFHAAAEAMRRILIEHARRRKRIKRGGGRSREPLEMLDLAVEDCAEDVLAVDAAIAQLESHDPRAAQVVRLRFYAGLSVDDTAAALGMSERSVKREWSFARAWLYRQLGGEAPAPESD